MLKRVSLAISHFVVHSLLSPADDCSLSAWTDRLAALAVDLTWSDRYAYQAPHQSRYPSRFTLFSTPPATSCSSCIQNYYGPPFYDVHRFLFV
jgi:hypothetical protein